MQNWMIRLSCRINALTGGDPDETLCCRVYRQTQIDTGLSRFAWEGAGIILDFGAYIIWEEDHHCFFQWVNFGAGWDAERGVLDHFPNQFNLPSRLDYELRRLPDVVCPCCGLGTPR